MSQPTTERELQLKAAYDTILNAYAEIVDQRNALEAAYLAQGKDLARAKQLLREATLRFQNLENSAKESQVWLMNAKKQWGVDGLTSFDVVWEDALKLKAENQALKDQLASLRHMENRADE